MRLEQDALGSRELNDNVYYGIQTQRADENFAISGKTIADIPGFVSSILQIKKAAAKANARAGVLKQDIAGAICQAADSLCETGQYRDFIVDIYHGGGGTAANMNANEVLANFANELLCGEKGNNRVHPNTHVNMGQSTNDVIPAAMKMSQYHNLAGLLQIVEDFSKLLRTKEAEFSQTVKLGRTCFQDALPITLGQQFNGYRGAFERMQADIAKAQQLCLELPLSATAIGTEFGTFPDYQEELFRALRSDTGIGWQLEHNLFDGLQNADVWVSISAILKATALNLNKLAADLRLMSSGPRAGLGEINLPAVQPGSSIMPGKVNPVMPEMAMQVYFRVLGNDAAISRACEGELDLNVWESLILNAVSESCELLCNCIPLFASKCVQGITANQDKCLQDAESSLALSTVIATLFDYQTASGLAKQADREGKNIRQVVIESGLMSAADAERYLNPLMMTSPQRFNPLFSKKHQTAQPDTESSPEISLS